MIGTKYACELSQNNKVRVSIGLAAANKQSPLLLHVEYKISLVNHDWVVAARQKLIPSVVAGVLIQPDGIGRAEAGGYSGPTYLEIRFSKHSPSTAYAHAMDFEHLFEVDEFRDMLKFGVDNAAKPIFIFTVDGS